MELSKLQYLLGTQYSEWRDIRRRLLDEPLEKIINELDFNVIIKPKKRGRKVTHVKFIMQRRKETAAKANVPLAGTFAALEIRQLYRISGGTDDVFVKTSNTTAQNCRTKKSVTMQNINVDVEVLHSRKP